MRVRAEVGYREGSLALPAFLIEALHPYEPLCPSLGYSVGWLVCRSFCHHFLKFPKDGKLHFHAPIGGVFILSVICTT